MLNIENNIELLTIRHTKQINPYAEHHKQQSHFA